MVLCNRTLVALVALGLAGGCDGGSKAEDAQPKAAAEKTPQTPSKAPEETPPEPEPEPEAAPGPKEDVGAAEPEPPAPPPEPGDPGPAYFAIDDKGVFVLEGGGFTKVAKAPDKLVEQMSLGADGKPYLLGIDGVMRLEGAKAKMVAKTSFEKTGNVDAFTVTSAGEIWTAGYKGIGHYAGGKWSMTDKKALGDDVSLLQGVAVDDEGRIWVVSSNALHRVDAQGKWSTVDLSGVMTRKPFFEDIVVDPSGGLVASASSEVLKIDGVDTLSTVSLPSDTIARYGSVAFASNGIGALKTSVKTVVRMDPGGDHTAYTLGDDLDGTRIVALAPDGQGRLWVATDAGIGILGPYSDRVTWPMGSIPELAGKVKGILVVGAGPQLPEVGEVQKATRFDGMILVGGKPLSGAPIELCPEPSSLIKVSPCEDSPIKFTGTTDEEGRFSFADVPLGAYGIGVKNGEKWKITYAGQYGAKMVAGKPFDVGKLKFDE